MTILFGVAYLDLANVVSLVREAYEVSDMR